MRILLILVAMTTLGIAATTDGGTVTIERPFELAFYVIALTILIVFATPSKKRLDRELARRRKGKEALDAFAHHESSGGPGRVFDWSRPADHQPGRSDRS